MTTQFLHPTDLTVACHVRTALVLEPIDAKIETLRACDAAGEIADLVVRSWPNEVTLGSDGPYHEVIDRFKEFERWADRNDVRVSPPFAIREKTTLAADEPREVLVTPILCLALYHEDRLVGVYPHSDGETTVTATEAIAALRTGEVPPSLGTAPASEGTAAIGSAGNGVTESAGNGATAVEGAGREAAATDGTTDAANAEGAGNTSNAGDASSAGNTSNAEDASSAGNTSNAGEPKRSRDRSARGSPGRRSNRSAERSTSTPAVACPDCGETLGNVQGILACVDCGWTDAALDRVESPRAKLIYLALLDDPASIETLRSAFGMKKLALYGILQTLSDRDLVEEVAPGTFRARRDPEPDATVRAVSETE